MQGIDALVMGRNTYETVRGFTPWPYDKPVYVVSRQWSALPGGAPATAQLWKSSLPALRSHLAASGVRAAYVDGGQLIQSFINARLLDEITITRIPVLLGSGLPLFGPLADDCNTVAAQHLQTRSYDFGFVQSDYRLEYPVSTSTPN